jgi:hypothetical protein
MRQTKSIFNELTLQMGEVLETLIDRGFVPPIYVAALSHNGSALCFVYDASPSGAGLEASVLCHHFAGRMMAMPINVMFVDKRGEATRVVLKADAAPKLSSQ